MVSSIILLKLRLRLKTITYLGKSLFTNHYTLQKLQGAKIQNELAYGRQKE